MNIAIIFAGGTGQRMNSRSKPKQFLELHQKPILVYTLEQFQYHPEIDGIILVTLADWIDYCEQLKTKYQLTKLVAIVSGGASATESAYNGLSKAAELYSEDSIVLIHDGVRPLVAKDTITKDIACVKEHGTAITVSPAIETITLFSDNSKNTENKEVNQVVERSKCLMARAPQCFYLKDVLSAYKKSRANGNRTFIDSATMMMHYGYKLYTVEGRPENIKITTPNDFYMFRAIMDARENTQIFGV
ncbi:IspD/TarI family cytidylyltransferase [Parabacteroides sp.]|uniref:IspD/TarI family cytidylyltransferase n=1 Tax=Parabacteroides sp. TaxID=1869337 RepID=UPI002579C18E|nr:IspD/TarI family cytidylyltransferase [Parabacteroides sp.]